MQIRKLNHAVCKQMRKNDRFPTVLTLFFNTLKMVSTDLDHVEHRWAKLLIFWNTSSALNTYVPIPKSHLILCRVIIF